MKTIHLIALLAVFAPVVLGSPQEPERLRLDGETLPVYGFKLSPELVASIDRIESERNYRISSTGNYDGFYAELELRERRLFLTGLWIKARKEDFANGRQPVPLTVTDATTAIHAEWFSGRLMVHEQTDENVTKPLPEVTLLSFKDGELVGREVQPAEPKEPKLELKNGEQGGTGQPATRPESKTEGSDKPQPESEGRSR